jgi:hypothetical protein
MKAELILGVWELISCEAQGEDNQSFLPYGPHPTGKLIYTHDGHLSVTLMSSERGLFASEEIYKATTKEVEAAFNSFDSYSGRWTLDEQLGRIEHIIEAGRIPNWVGKTHTRHISFNEGLLVLSTEKFTMNGDTWRVHVKWQRPQARQNALN